MALTKEKKGEILNKLKDIFSNAESAVFVKFRGLPVADTSEMRNALREEGVGYFVAKKFNYDFTEIDPSNPFNSITYCE